MIFIPFGRENREDCKNIYLFYNTSILDNDIQAYSLTNYLVKMKGHRLFVIGL